MTSFQPVYITITDLTIPLTLCVVLAFLFAAVARLIWRQSVWSVFSYYTLFSIPVGMIAYVAGDATGISRAPAVGNVVPAVLALIAGANVYVFGTDAKYKVVVGYCVTTLALLFFLGLQTGSYYREQQQEEYLIHLSESEFRVRNFRSNLDLPTEMPNWITGSEKQ